MVIEQEPNIIYYNIALLRFHGNVYMFAWFFLIHLNMWCIYFIDKGDPCGNVCQNGGICELIVDSASRCKCPLGFTGEFCQNGMLHLFLLKKINYNK